MRSSKRCSTTPSARWSSRCPIAPSAVARAIGWRPATILSGEPPLRQPDTLTQGQRAALTALVACEPFWEVVTNLLMLYGLPMSRETLVEWLSAP